MGRQWLHKKRMVAGLAKGKTNNKLVRDIALAALAYHNDVGATVRAILETKTGSE